MSFQKIIIFQQDSVHIVDYNDVIYCQSDNYYTFINTLDARKIIVVKSLARFAKEELTPSNFIRVGQSYVINRNYIKTIDKRNRQLILENEHIIPFTVSFKQLLSLLKDESIPNSVA